MSYCCFCNTVVCRWSFGVLLWELASMGTCHVICLQFQFNYNLQVHSN